MTLDVVMTGLQAFARGFLVRRRRLAGLMCMLDPSFGPRFVTRLVAELLDTDILPDVLRSFFHSEVRGAA
jgi:hypothetical protein